MTYALGWMGGGRQNRLAYFYHHSGKWVGSWAKSWGYYSQHFIFFLTNELAQ